MYPVSYTLQDDGSAEFTYDRQDYDQWETRGKSHGDAGALMIAMRGKLITYHMFGTQRCPNRIMYRIQMVHNEADGPMHTPDWYLKSAVQQRAKRFWETISHTSTEFFNINKYRMEKWDVLLH